MATLSTITPTSGGATATPAAVSATDKFANSGRTLILVENGGGGSINATFDSQLTADGNAVADKVVAIGAGVTKVIGPFDPGIYNDADGFVNVAFSGQTSVVATVIQVP